MKKIEIQIVLSVALILISCNRNARMADGKQKKLPESEVIIEPISMEEMPEWKNRIEYDELEDQLKNLDFTQLNNDSLDEKSAMLFGLIEMGINGDQELFVEKLKKAYQAETGENIKGLLGHILVEFLNNQSKYQEAVEIFSLEPQNVTSILAGFPAEEFLPTENQVEDTLIRGLYNHARITTVANDIPVQMMFDTGADWTLLSETRATKVGAIIDSVEHELNSSTNIKVTAKFGYIEELRVGNVLIKNHHILVLNDQSTFIKTDTSIFDIGAIFGWNAIKNLRVVADDVNKRWRVDLSKPDTATLNNFFWFGYPGFKMVAENGQSLAFGFDSGASGSEITPHFLSKFPDLKIKKESAKEGGVGGIEEIETKSVEDVKLYFSNHKFTFRKLQTFGEGQFAFINEDGTIGIDILKKNRITMDYKNKLLLIE